MELPTVDESLARLTYSRRTLYNRFKGLPMPVGGWVRDERLTEAAVEIIFPDRDWRLMPILQGEPTDAESPPSVALVQSLQSECSCTDLHSDCTGGENDIVLDDIQARLTQALEAIERLEGYAASMAELAGSLISTVQRLEARVQFAERRAAAMQTQEPAQVTHLQRLQDFAGRFSQRVSHKEAEPEIYTANRLRG